MPVEHQQVESLPAAQHPARSALLHQQQQEGRPAKQVPPTMGKRRTRFTHCNRQVGVAYACAAGSQKKCQGIADSGPHRVVTKGTRREIVQLHIRSQQPCCAYTNCMAMIKGFVPAPGIGEQQIVKRCNSLSYYYYCCNISSVGSNIECFSNLLWNKFVNMDRGICVTDNAIATNSSMKQCLSFLFLFQKC